MAPSLAEIAVKKIRSQFEISKSSCLKENSSKQRVGLPLTFDLAKELVKLKLPASVIAQICFEGESQQNFEKGLRFITAQKKLQAFQNKLQSK